MLRDDPHRTLVKPLQTPRETTHSRRHTASINMLFARPSVVVAATALTCAGLVLFARWRRRLHRPAPSLPRAHVVSLARFPAARAAVLRRAAAAGLKDVQIFEAVDGRELSTAELTRQGVKAYPGWKLTGTGFRFFDRDLKWGEVGCALSHVGVWRRIAAESDQPVAVVLEDDVDFAPRFAELVLEALAQIQQLVADGTIEAPDALYLGRKAMRPEHDRVLPRPASRDGHAASSVRLLVPGFSYKTTAYILWRSGAEKLLRSGYEEKLIPVDDFLALTYAPHEAKAGVARADLDELFADAPRLKMLAVRPNLCWERRGISSTENSAFITEESRRAPMPKT